MLPPMQLRGNSVKVTKKHGVLREESVGCPRGSVKMEDKKQTG